MHQYHGRRRASGMALALLLGQMAQVGFDNIPPVTLVTIAGQVCIFLELPFTRWLPNNNVCISTMSVWYWKDYKRLFLSSLFHVDEWHLYFNMASLLWKGIKLESALGSVYFAYLLTVFTVLTNALYVGLGLGLEEWLHDSNYLLECAVGFSGVLFALKVITTHQSSGTQRLMGFIPVPSRYACWAELVLIHLLVPRTSFRGHLSGIIIGLLYVKGPLKSIMDMFFPSELFAGNGTRRGHFTGSFTSRRYRDWGSGYAAGSGSTNHSPHTRETPRSYHNHSYLYTGGLSEEEQMEQAMRQSLRQTGGRPEPSAPPMDIGVEDTFPPYQEPPGSAAGGYLYPDLSNISGSNQSTISSPSVTAEEIRQ